MAFTETEVFVQQLGNRLFGCFKLTGDASDTTFSAPCGVIDAAWVQSYAASGAGVTDAITWATNVITFQNAPGSGDIYHVFFVGV